MTYISCSIAIQWQPQKMTDLQTCAIVKFYPADKYQFQVDQVDTRDSKQNLVVVASSLLTFNSYLPRE